MFRLICLSLSVLVFLSTSYAATTPRTLVTHALLHRVPLPPNDPDTVTFLNEIGQLFQEKLKLTEKPEVKGFESGYKKVHTRRTYYRLKSIELTAGEKTLKCNARIVRRTPSTLSRIRSLHCL